MNLWLAFRFPVYREDLLPPGQWVTVLPRLGCFVLFADLCLKATSPAWDPSISMFQTIESDDG